MQTPGANKKGSVTTYVAICLLIASAGSLFNPVLSLYLNTELGMTPVQISIFFVLLPIATITIVQTVARFSDMGLQRPAIICMAALFGIGGSIVLYVRPGFLLLCTLGLLCLASSPVAFPQIFASAREYSTHHMKSSIMFTTFLRALASLSWVIGPPVSFAIALGYSFDLLFLVTMAMFALCAIACFFLLPSLKPVEEKEQVTDVKWWRNHSVMLLFIAIAFLFTAFSSYCTAIPLYLTQELKLERHLPGTMMGLAAFLEIPLMFMAAKLSNRVGLKNVVIIGALSLLAYLALLTIVHTSDQILWIQIFSALFIAGVGSIGMVLFQELLPAIPGQATSLFINASTAGQITGGALISLASSGSYRIIFEAGVVIALIGTAMLFFVRTAPGAAVPVQPPSAAA